MRNKMLKRVTAVAAATMMTFLAMVPGTKITHAQGNDDVIKLRVCNWEEYIDLGDWDEEERMELENGAEIFGENSMVDDFTGITRRTASAWRLSIRASVRTRICITS